MKIQENHETLRRGDLQYWMSSDTRKNLLRKSSSSWIKLNGLMGLYSMVLIFWDRAETSASFTSSHMEWSRLEKTTEIIKPNLQPIYYEELGKETLRDEREPVQGNPGTQRSSGSWNFTQFHLMRWHSQSKGWFLPQHPILPPLFTLRVFPLLFLTPCPDENSRVYFGTLVKKYVY